LRLLTTARGRPLVELHGSDLAAVLIGMPEFVVLAAVEEDGEVWLLAETTNTSTGCPSCGGRAKAKDRRQTTVRDLPAAGRPVVLVWRKRRGWCPDPDCEAKTWSEAAEGIAPRAVLTNRARREICRRVGEEARSVAEVAKSFGISWDTAMEAVREHGQPLVDDADGIDDVEDLGIDETAWLAATPTHPTLWATGLVDTRRGRLVDVICGRDAAQLRNWLAGRPDAWLEGVATVSIDPHEAYRNGLFPHLAHATVVADPFHITRVGNRALDDARRRTQKELTGHRGRRGDPLYDIRKILLTGAERLGERGWARLRDALRRGDPHDEVLACWLAKEHLREVYAVDDPEEAARLLDAVVAEGVDSAVPELVRLAGTVRRWREPILNHHRTGRSNGPTEAMNLLIKQIKRVGRGFTNFDNYRLRLLLHCGVEWDTHRTASMRGRRPHLAA
jgi:transposase